MATVTVTAAAAVDDDDDGTITTVVRRRNKTYALCKDKKLSLSLSLLRRSISRLLSERTFLFIIIGAVSVVV